MASLQRVARLVDNEPMHSKPALSSGDEPEFSTNAEDTPKSSSSAQVNATESEVGTKFQIWFSFPFTISLVALNSVMSVRRGRARGSLHGARNIFILLGVHIHDNYHEKYIYSVRKASTIRLDLLYLDRRRASDPLHLACML
jgi:hypothetical protein